MNKLFGLIVERLVFPHVLELLEQKRREEETVLYDLVPGGKLPVRATDGAIGYDTFIRAVVSPTDMDPENPTLRKLLFDFKTMPTDPEVARQVVETPNGLVYRMRPQESITVGIGFITAMVFPVFYWATPRSGLSSRKGITVTNAPGTVDPDYRGEAGILVYNRNDHPFDIGYEMRIAQTLFQKAIIPTFVPCPVKNMPISRRGAGGFGSTGEYEVKT